MVHQQIFQFFQPMQMPLELRVAPLREPAHILAAKAKVRALDLLPLAFRVHHFVSQQEQPFRLRRKLVERAPQHFMREPVRRRDIVERHFDVFERLAAVRHGLAWPLVLVQQRDRADERRGISCDRAAFASGYRGT